MDSSFSLYFSSFARSPSTTAAGARLMKPSLESLPSARLISLSIGLDYSRNANVAYFDRISLVYDESRATSYDYAGENIATITLPDGKRVEYTYTDGNAPHSPSTVTATKRRSPRSFSLPLSPPLRRRQARSGISTAKSSLSRLRKTHKTQELLSIGAVRL